jgi:hypothetical protein
MTATDERAGRALRALAAEIESEVDTEAALASVQQSHRRIPPGVWLGLAAASVAALVVAAVTVAGDEDEVVVRDDPVTTTVPAPTPAPTTVAPTTVAPTTTPASTTVAPTTAAPTTAAPTTTPASGDPLAGATVDATGIGPLRVGMTLDELAGWEQDFELGPTCGAVTPNPDTWDRLRGRVVQGDDGVFRVDAVYTADAGIRTAEGLGVGSTIDEVRGTYGDRLIERRPEVDATGTIVHTDPPYAYYGAVAAVFEGDTAITFWLDPLGESVDYIKVSTRDFAGDDEGCA